MNKLETTAVRFRNIHLQKKNAFNLIRIIGLTSTLKQKYNSFSLLDELNIDKSGIDHQTHNKALYLQYVGSVLTKKQENLLQWQHKLSQKEHLLTQQAYDQQITHKINAVADIKAIQCRIFAIGNKILSSNPGFNAQTYSRQYEVMRNQAKLKCEQFKQSMQTQFKMLYDEITMERMLLRNKISQYTELSAYQKYLNELHDALQQRNAQLIQREQNTKEHNFKIQEKIQNNHPDNSSRKRHKIFNRNSQKSNNNNSSELPQQLIWGQNETFAEGQSDIVSVNKKHKQQSSQIMVENQSSFNRNFAEKDSYQHNISDAGQESSIPPCHFFHQQKIKPAHRQQQSVSPIITVSKGVQFHGHTEIQISQRLGKQKLILKYLQSWIKSSMHKNQPVAKKKLFALYLWRTNAIYDESIQQKFIKSMKIMEKMWRKKIKNSNILSYSQLSLKRKKYYELFIDFQAKKNNRQHMQRILGSILRNKNRKERLTFFYYFIRFYKNTRIRDNILKNSSKNSVINNNIQASRMVSASSSNVLKEQKICSPFSKPNQNKSTAKKSIVSNKNSQKLNNSSNNSLRGYHPHHSMKQLVQQSIPSSNKQNTSKQSMNKQNQIIELKNYIGEKERIEKLLATQCVKLQGMIKMVTILSSLAFKTNSQFFKRLTEKQYEERIGSLSTHISSLEFKLELIVTKCRLGLANNSNKLSTLQNLLGFTNFIK